MKSNNLIIITGAPGVGKTTLAKNISQKLSIPFIHKDGIKEILFDTLGWSDREWSTKLGISSFSLLYYFLENLMQAQNSLVIEANFSRQYDSQHIQSLADKFKVELYQIHCFALPEVAYERFASRMKSGQRHPGHVDHHNFDSYTKTWGSKNFRLDILGKTLDLDMTDLKKVKVDRILNELNLVQL